MFDFARARRTMVDCQVRTFDVTDRTLLAVLEDMPRERFVPAEKQIFAYSDQRIIVSDDGEEERFLLPPLIFARMAQALGLQPGERLLDVGSATGYSSAVLAALGAQVTALESSETLTAVARERAKEFGHDRVEAVTGALDKGWPAGAPYDAIFINGAFEVVPAALIAQLADGGRLVGIALESGVFRAVFMQRAGDAAGKRPLFEAPAPVLGAFRAPADFVF